ncbi:hypothetical protein WICMUC_004855 [Wickerhamomyces mucosus]|uniref:Mannan endo-1,6-alpha-mannosidase n=1 Tax=Wickerhamomyces mucosus TaxID=1378264 RepID=A0A9P8PF84_9ASCO|nr:hypothetical protein WICMUC_004855 [Wickerhamomyces mucosus]
MQFNRLIYSVFALLQISYAIDLDITSTDSVCNAASLVIDGVLDYYLGTRYGGTVGMFQEPYYWWESGGAFGSMIDFWYFCQNDTFEDLIYEGLIAQKGSNNDYIPANQSTTEGNDDQGFWGLAVMEATERNFTNPPSDQAGWLALTQAVFNTMWARWDTQYCGGGLRWQIFTWNSGYSYKNTVSSACLFAIGARLGRYTANDTYIEVANTVFEWLEDIEFIVESNGAYSVYDGAQISSNCSEITTIEWSYNFALLLSGSAYAYNYTEESIWLERTNALVSGASIFFQNNIMYERACQGSGTCNNDERSFKAYLARSLGQTAVLVPSTYDTIYPWIEASAQAAASTCNGGSDGHTCVLNWQNSSATKEYGLGEQMSALEIFQNLLINERPAPYTDEAGGSSTGDASAGISSSSDSSTLSGEDLNITSKDKAGSGVLTAVILALLTGGTIWMVV